MISFKDCLAVGLLGCPFVRGDCCIYFKMNDAKCNIHLIILQDTVKDHNTWSSHRVETGYAGSCLGQAT